MVNNSAMINLLNLGKSMKFKGQKVYIRAPKRTEIEFIRSLWQDKKTMSEVGGIVKRTKREMLKWFLKMVNPQNKHNFYCLIFNHNNNPIGEVSFHRFNIINSSADLNIKVKYNYRGNGYAKESLLLLLNYFFNHFGGKIIKDKVAQYNISGQKFLKRFGFDKIESNKDYVLFSLTYKQFSKICKKNNYFKDIYHE